MIKYLNEKSHLRRQRFLILHQRFVAIIFFGRCKDRDNNWIMQVFERKCSENVLIFKRIMYICRQITKIHSIYIIMTWSIICLIIFAVCILLLVIYKKDSNKHKIPETIIDRIGVSAVCIQKYFIDKGLSSSKEDKAIWNIISFIIAYLIECKICTVVDQIHIQLGFKNIYPNEDEGFTCNLWINEGVAFYRKQIKKMRYETNQLPDVIVYNLIYPNIDKTERKDMPIFEVNILAYIEYWEYINHIMNIFFINDENIQNIPLGCKV